MKQNYQYQRIHGQLNVKQERGPELGKPYSPFREPSWPISGTLFGGIWGFLPFVQWFLAFKQKEKLLGGVLFETAFRELRGGFKREGLTQSRTPASR